MQASKQQIKRLGRLKKRSDFLRANDRTAQSPVAKWVAKGMILLTLPNEYDCPRAGITVTKKLDKSAVRRNRMKRRLRAAARDVLSQQGLDGADYVLIARPETATRPYADLKKDLAWCLKRLAQRVEEESGSQMAVGACVSGKAKASPHQTSAAGGTDAIPKTKPARCGVQYDMAKDADEPARPAADKGRAEPAPNSRAAPSGSKVQ